jgi:hypothetical protein
MKKRDPFKGLATSAELGLQREQREARVDEEPADAPWLDEGEVRHSEEHRTGSRDDE